MKLKAFSFIVALTVLTAASGPAEARRTPLLSDPVTVVFQTKWRLESPRAQPAAIQVLLPGTDAAYSVPLSEPLALTSRVGRDDRGNRLAGLLLLPGLGGRETSFESRVRLSRISYALTRPMGPVPDKRSLPPEAAVYLLPSDRIQSDAAPIREQAERIRSKALPEQSRDLYDLIKAVYQDVQTTMQYTDRPGYTNQGALFALRYRLGNCEDYASLFVALLRALDIPARTVTGFQLDERNLQTDYTGLYDPASFAYHMWAEVYIPSYGWVPFDPTDTGDSYVTREIRKRDKVEYVMARSPAKAMNTDYFGALNGYYLKMKNDRPLLADSIQGAPASTVSEEAYSRLALP